MVKFKKLTDIQRGYALFVVLLTTALCVVLHNSYSDFIHGKLFILIPCIILISFFCWIENSFKH
jgi:uncharacterized membrane protein YhaH (DUF805 family)